MTERSNISEVEYRTDLVHFLGIGQDPLVALCEVRGEDGWERVNVTPGPTTSTAYVQFRRPKQSDDGDSDG